MPDAPHKTNQERIEANKLYWNDSALFNSKTWDVAGFIADPTKLAPTVRIDQHALEDVRGKTLPHLQCHFGMDTLSWARLGAKVTGLDISPDAIGIARRLARDTGITATFVESPIYDAPSNLQGQFDIVYTGVGALTWLPDIAAWGKVVAGYVRPGGTFFIRDAHPMLYALDDGRTDGVLSVAHPYFQQDQPVAWESDAVWAGGRKHPPNYSWNHGLGEVFGALTAAGLRIEEFAEHQYMAWQALPQMVEGDDSQ